MAAQRPPTKKFVRSEFGERIIRHAMRERAVREHGRADARVSPMFTRWEDGIFPPIARALSKYVKASGLREHEYLRAVNSSQAFAFNLFFPFWVADPAPLADVLGQRLGRRLRTNSVEFEYRGSADVLGEWKGEAPEKDEPHTTADVGLRVEDVESGQSGLVLVEVKLSEEDFTNCNGASSSANRARHVCESGTVFFDEPDRCYLRRTVHATKDRRYWEIFRAAMGESSLRVAFPRADQAQCPFRSGNQQIMRNHALALALVQSGEFAFCAVGLAHHDENPDVVPVWDGYAAMTSLPGLFRLPFGELVSAAGETGWWPEWKRYMRERYDLRS